MTEDTRKTQFDSTGVAAMVGFTMLMAFNQVLVKFVNTGLQPVFQAGLRSALAALVMTIFVYAMGKRYTIKRAYILPGLFIGFLFGAEFLFLFIALDLTTVSRTTLLFYTMPLWMAVLAHLFIPGERLTPIRWAGIIVAIAGVVLVLSERLFAESAEGNLGWLGDLLCLTGAAFWALLALTIRLTSFGEASNETQLSFQLVISAVILIPASVILAIIAPDSALFGPLIRDFTPLIGGIVVFQVVVVVCFGFTAWLWIVRHYPATQMASFIFLTPVFGAAFGVPLLGEPLTFRLVAALALVSIGIVLINRK